MSNNQTRVGTDFSTYKSKHKAQRYKIAQIWRKTGSSASNWIDCIVNTKGFLMGFMTKFSKREIVLREKDTSDAPILNDESC